ncbi:Syntaxin-binding protein 5, partial [Geodia barretti]
TPLPPSLPPFLSLTSRVLSFPFSFLPHSPTTFSLYNIPSYSIEYFFIRPLYLPLSDPWIICSGGYPEESHSCPKTITVRHGKSITLLSTNSTIIDFISLPSTPFAMDPQKPLALVILTKDDLVVHDLQTENFPLFSLPHALDIHIPPVSCLEFYGNCPEELVASLHSVKSKMLHNFNSSRLWPVMGGKWGHESPYLPTDLVLTGHTDGSVRLWYCSSVIFQPFFTLPTTPFFKYNYTLSPSTPTRRPPQRNAEDLLPLPPPLPNHPRPSLPSTTQRRHTETGFPLLVLLLPRPSRKRRPRHGYMLSTVKTEEANRGRSPDNSVM